MSNYHARTYAAQRRRREAAQWTRLLVGFAIAVSGLVGFHAVIADQAAGTGGYDPALNQPSYWGDDCVKTEQGLQGPRWYTPVTEGYRLVVLKSALVNDQFFNVPADTAVSTVSGKDISHVIYCGPTTPPTTTTAPPTTTEPPSTTTQPVPTTTEPEIPATTTTLGPSPTTVPEVPCEEDEPCWDCETMGNRICGEIPVMPPPVPVVTTPRFTG